MFFKWLLNQMHAKPKLTVADVLSQCKQSNDYTEFLNHQKGFPYILSYYETLIDADRLNQDVTPYLKKEAKTLEELIEDVPIQNKEISDDPQQIKTKVMQGFVLLRKKGEGHEVALIEVTMDSGREVQRPEVEFSVSGPQESFVEALQININLIRKRLPMPQLKVEQLTVGQLTKTKVALLYIEGIANEENVNTIRQRIDKIEFDQVVDSNSLAQMITDKSLSIFPQLINTERPERVAAVLAEGKVAFLCDGSPEVIFGPSTLVEFFSSLEDYYLTWQIATFVRLLRFFSVTFSVLATPVYIAVLTFHYELIPKDLLATIIASRSNIPLPPFIEAIILELTIELLREAGARLPTKVGQTIGIVGGIVIGQASVEAGLTSNVLLIIVALAALASFTTPVYQMGNTIRLLRFPFMIAAAALGLIGITVCTIYLIVHLLRLTSLGRPYLQPIYPFRFKDFRDAFVRMPFSWMAERPQLTRPKDRGRLNFFRANERRDIDE
ncbi:spore germination protein [Halalkalibacterium halodurans]|uniref:spore germination protein n=1 Tax=Halalkalibacterium halodurans TaxID=86665 RepID=UPI002E2210EE|nr:spore germination protein [Halalkalibacterium halodurans]